MSADSLAQRALLRAARALDRMASLAGSSAVGRYDRPTNAYEDALTNAYAAWTTQLLKNLSGTPDEQQVQVAEALPDLQRTLQDLGQATLPEALTLLGHNYVPSPDAYQMIAQAINDNNATITDRLIPDLLEKLQRGIAEQADLAGVAASLTSRVASLAGMYWVTIQRSIGDFAAQAETADDEIYPARWKLDPGAQHCESCSNFAGEYPSYNAMLQATNQCVPGYFFGSPYQSCYSNCRCRLQLKINGAWVNV